MNKSAEELKSTTAVFDLDGFDGHTDECEYEDERPDRDQLANERVIEGDRIGFDPKKGVWINIAKQPLPPDLLLLLDNMKRVVQKWGKDGMPSEPPIILGPNEKWPDVDAMNARCPKTEWRDYFNKSIGPYQKQKLLYFWDASVNMKKYTWPANSNSPMASVSDLVDKIEMMRQFKKVKAIPIVKLSSRLWSRRNGTLAPDFIIVRWVAKDASGTLQLTAESAEIAGPKPTIQDALDEFAGMKTVEKPTGKEATGDSIQY